MVTTVSIVIPARLASTRLPKKVLLDLAGKPLLKHVWEKAMALKDFYLESQKTNKSERLRIIDVCVVADSIEVNEAVQSWGGKVLLSSPDCPSGTARMTSVVEHLPGDYLLNIQADEPFVPLNLLKTVLEQACMTNADMVTPIFKIETVEALLNPNIVKVLINSHGRALYFSRSPIPYVRDYAVDQWLKQTAFYGHLGIYCYKRQLLEHYTQLKPSQLEKAEKLEQLIFIENNCQIQTVMAEEQTISIDTLEDLYQARKLAIVN
jgi:3-deoxy-manno-octulosonate cytidylyltransferase (CMP-KDO synthetase)